MPTAIDHIETLVAKAGELVETKAAIWKLKATGKMADTGSSLITLVAIVCCTTIALLIISIGAAFLIGTALHNTGAGFLIVGGFYLLTGFFIWIFRRQLIKEPLSNLIIRKLTHQRL